MASGLEVHTTHCQFSNRASMMFLQVVTVFVITACWVPESRTEDGPQVVTPLGKVRGHYRTSYKGNRFSAFEGIPYANPPIGDLRFKEPEMVQPWTGIWEATQRYTCMQINVFSGASHKGVLGHEDCLYINVYSPRERPDEADNLDVVVYIHGGGFVMGSAHMAQPTLLMDRGFVMVTFNYRLGVLGFLCTMEEGLSCNNGLKDQSMALKWIQENIKSFGGNPGSVTITGISAGGASVHYHYLSPLSKGLFHRGLSQSGTAISPWALQEDPLQNAQTIANYVGCSIFFTASLIECLKERPAALLVAGTWELYQFLIFPLTPFTPTLELDVEGRFLADHPFKLLQSGEINDVPLIFSATLDEGFVFIIITYLYDHLDSLNERWDDVIHYILTTNRTVTAKNRETLAQQIKEHYFGENVISQNNLGELSNLLSDRHFLTDFQRASQMQAKVAKSPVYSFILEYSGQNGFFSKMGLARYFGTWDAHKGTVKGATHGDDLQFLFGAPEETLDENDEAVTEIYLNMLESFVKTGSPEIKDINWQPVSRSDDFSYLVIKGPNEINIQSAEDLGQIKFWRSLPLREYDGVSALRDEL